MSSVYATEPATSGRVLLETTHGPLELQLWCRECPLTTKLFLQLCIDDYFQGMLFHRIVPDLLIQTGALRQGGIAGFTKDYRDAIAAQDHLDRRKYEVHSRLRFNHRGQVAMALGVHDEDDSQVQPQFFITLDEAPYLDAKHVLFGTVVGPTMFNALRIGKLECNADHQPVDLEYAPRITGTRILENPLLDLRPSLLVPWKDQPKDAATKIKKKKRKGKRDLNVLSFGNELEDDDLGGGIQSSHDIVTSKSLKKEVDEAVEHAAKAKIQKLEKSIEQPVPLPEDELNPPKMQLQPDPIRYEPTVKSPIERRPPEPPLSLPLPKASSKASTSSFVEARLQKYKQGSAKNKQHRQDDTMAKLMAFQSKVRNTVVIKTTTSTTLDDDGLAARLAKRLQKPTPNETMPEGEESYHGQVMETEDDPQENWLGTTFRCKRHVDLDSREGLGGDGRSVNEYLVVDPKNEVTSRRNDLRR